MDNPVRAIRLKLLLILPLALLGFSCGGQGEKRVNVVGGKVFYQNKPMPKAIVYLHPIDQEDPSTLVRPCGVVEEDGSFHLSTYETNDGAPVGRYRVTVVWRSPGRRGDDNGESLIPEYYASPQTSQLTVEVTDGVHELPALMLN